MRGIMPTPMIGLKRKIAEKFKTYSLDEFRTSCLNYKTETKCENLELPDKTGKSRKIHREQMLCNAKHLITILEKCFTFSNIVS